MSCWDETLNFESISSWQKKLIDGIISNFWWHYQKSVSSLYISNLSRDVANNVTNLPCFTRGISITSFKFILYFEGVRVKVIKKALDLPCIKISLPSWHLLVQIQQWTKYQSNVWNLFKFNNKDTRTMSMMLFWCLYC